MILDFGQPKSVESNNTRATLRTLHKGAFMTTVTIELPESIAQQASQAGLLDSRRIETLLRAALRERAALGLRSALTQMDAVPVPQLTAAEIATEVKAARAAYRTMAGDAPRR